MEQQDLPHAVDIEQAVIGLCLLRRDMIVAASEILEPDHFYDVLHQRMFEMLVCLESEGHVSPLILHAAMKHDPGLQQLGGMDYLGGLLGAAPATSEMAPLARVIRDTAVRRALVNTGYELIEEANKPSRESPSTLLIARAADSLMRLEGNVRKPAISPYRAGEIVLEEAVRANRGQRPPSILTGLGKFDEATGGLRGSEHVEVCARTGMGKTALLSSVCLTAALAGHPVKVFNNDMSSKIWMRRTLCDLAMRRDPLGKPIYVSKFRRGTLSNYEIDRLAEANTELANLDYEITDDPEITIGMVRGQSRAFAARHPGRLGLILVDVLQRVKPDKVDNRRSRETDVGEVAYGMREIARALDWAVVSAVQLLNKNPDPKASRKEEPPTAADIRESGQIEMAGDIIVSPFRRAFFHQMRQPNKSADPDGYEIWKIRMAEIEHEMQLIGFKFREGSPAELTGDYWVDMGTNSIFDQKPAPATPA